MKPLRAKRAIRSRSGGLVKGAPTGSIARSRPANVPLRLRVTPHASASIADGRRRCVFRSPRTVELANGSRKCDRMHRRGGQEAHRIVGIGNTAAGRGASADRSGSGGCPRRARARRRAARRLRLVLTTLLAVAVGTFARYWFGLPDARVYPRAVRPRHRRSVLSHRRVGHALARARAHAATRVRRAEAGMARGGRSRRTRRRSSRSRCSSRR